MVNILSDTLQVAPIGVHCLQIYFMKEKEKEKYQLYLKCSRRIIFLYIFYADEHITLKL